MKIKTFATIVGLLVASIIHIADASDIKTSKRKLYPPRCCFFVQEEFLGGSASSAILGSYGMGQVAGGATFQASESNRPGIFRKDTSAISDTISSVVFYAQSIRAFLYTEIHKVLWIVRPNDTADTTVGINPVAQVTNTGAAASKSLDIDYFSIKISGIIR